MQPMPVPSPGNAEDGKFLNSLNKFKMNKLDFKAVAEFITKCDNILAGWNAQIRVQSVVELHSIDGQAIEPQLKLRVAVFQEENHLSEFPDIPIQTIEPNFQSMNFYFMGLKQTIIQNL